MSTAFPYVQVATPEQKKLVGKPDRGTRIYRREGTYSESGEWYDGLIDIFHEEFVSPGGVCMFVPASRAAVHKRMKEGRLTAFCFHVVRDERTFFGNVRKAKATPFVYIPVSECKAWARELEEKRGAGVTATDEDWDDGFLRKDPEDCQNRKVRYTDKHMEEETRKSILRELKGKGAVRTKRKEGDV